MMEDNKKILTVSFVTAAIVVYYTVHLLLQFFAQMFTVVSRVESVEVLSNGIPVGLGILTFVALQFNNRSVDFFDGVVSELRKVVWPTRRDTGLMTVAVVIVL